MPKGSNVFYITADGSEKPGRSPKLSLSTKTGKPTKAKPNCPVAFNWYDFVKEAQVGDIYEVSVRRISR